jgi:hypothetical protein
MRSLLTLLVGSLLLAAPGMRGQTAPASTPAKKPAAAASVPAAKPKPASKPAASPAKPTGNTAQAAKPAGKTSKPATKSSKKTPAPAVKNVSEKRPAESEQKIARRDPFESLIGRGQGGGAEKNLPPGKAGLQVGTLRLDGIVKSVNGMIAVVANPQQRTYFLREGDQLYDGKVEKISMEGVTFHEEGKDAFGKPVEREVSKRLYSSAGEQQ